MENAMLPRCGRQVGSSSLSQGIVGCKQPLLYNGPSDLLEQCLMDCVHRRVSSSCTISTTCSICRLDVVLCSHVQCEGKSAFVVSLW